jgi:hypothetical protein
MALASDAPTRRYYGACVGAWRGAVTFRITDEARFRAAPLAWLDRLRVRGAAVASARIATTVAFLAHDEVLHTTRISAMGLPSLVGHEILKLDPDGVRFTFTLAHRFFPTFGSRRSGPFDGEVDPTGTRATYRVAFFGYPMTQTGTLLDPDHVTLAQTTDWSESEQQLTRSK